MASFQQQQPKRYAAIRIGLGLLAAVATIIGVLLVFRVPLATLALTSIIDERGFGPASLSIDHFGSSQIIISSGTLLDGRVTFNTVTATYRIGDLLNGQLNHLSIDGLSVRGTLQNGQLFLGLPEPPQTEKTLPSPSSVDNSQPENLALPFNHLEITNTSFLLETIPGPVTSRSDLAISRTGNTWDASLNFTIEGQGLALEFSGKGALDLTAPFDSQGSGRLSIAAKDFSLTQPELNLSGSALIDFSSDSRIFKVSGSFPATFTVDGLGPLLSAWLPTELTTEQEMQSLNLVLSDNGNNGMSLVLDGSGTKRQGFADFRLEANMGSSRAEVALKGQATASENGLPENFIFERLRGTIEGIPTPYGTLSADITGDGLSGPLTIARGPVDAAFKLTKPRIGNFSGEEIDGRIDTEFRLDGLALAFGVEALNFHIRSGIYAETLALGPEAKLSLAGISQAFQTINMVFGAGGNATLTHSLGLALEAPDMTLHTENSSISTAFILSNITSEGFWTPSADAFEQKFLVRNGYFSFGELLNGTLDGDLRSQDQQLNGSLSVALSPSKSGELKTNGLKLTGPLKVSMEGIDFKSEITSGDGQNIGDTSTNIDTINGRGDITVQLDTTFDPSGLTIADLWPSTSPLHTISGRLAINMGASWNADGLTHNGDILLEDLSFNVGNITVENVNSVIVLDQLWPPRSSAPQPISVALISAGLPVSNLLATLDLDGSEAAQIKDMTMELAGGRVTGQTTGFSLTGDETETVLTVTGVELGQLARLSRLTGLQADGTLSGTIPVYLGQTGVLIKGAELVNDAPGHIRYRPNEPPPGFSGAGGTDVLMQALSDFHYNTLILSLNGPAAGELEAKLALKGNNPALYDGYPIEFNLNLTGELSNVIQRSLAGYRVPETIQQRIMEFQNNR